MPMFSSTFSSTFGCRPTLDCIQVLILKSPNIEVRRDAIFTLSHTWELSPDFGGDFSSVSANDLFRIIDGTRCRIINSAGTVNIVLPAPFREKALIPASSVVEKISFKF